MLLCLDLDRCEGLDEGPKVTRRHEHVATHARHGEVTLREKREDGGVRRSQGVRGITRHVTNAPLISSLFSRVAIHRFISHTSSPALDHFQSTCAQPRIPLVPPLASPLRLPLRLFVPSKKTPGPSSVIITSHPTAVNQGRSLASCAAMQVAMVAASPGSLSPMRLASNSLYGGAYLKE